MLVISLASMVLNAHNWLINNPEKAAEHQGKWVAISGTGIKCEANDLRGLLKETHAKKYLITKIPATKELMEIL
jgi:hypothetical protein